MNYFEINTLSDYFSGLSGLGVISYVFVFLIVVLCIYIVFYLYIVNLRASKFERWKFIADTLIRNAIFFEEDESASSGYSLLKVLKVNTFPIPDRVKKLLQDTHFRNLIIKELIDARRNITGDAALNLESLFKQLELDQDVLKMINSNSWYLKASGIQYLGIMKMDEYKNLIFPYTNKRRGLIRMEAQNTIVKFSGFDGLRFLDKASFPITEWQQIKLLEELSQLPGENFTGIEKWLNSSNDTIVIFALKLARNYFRFELYENIISCLEHANPEVRRQAILSTKELQTATTAAELIKIYDSETERNKLAIVKVLEDVSTEAEFPFLFTIFEQGNNQVKIAAAKAIAATGNGIEKLEFYENSNLYPYKEIINQVKAIRK